jgi:large subunit ribosomal protein L15
MKLNELQFAKGSRKKSWRTGRGPGSGNGKTAGMGSKGQKARGGSKFGFEGGQMPLQRRMPKRGFRNANKIEYSIVNIESLNCFDDGTRVDPKVMVEMSLVKNVRDGVKILGTGDMTKKLTVVAHKFSAVAKTKIEAAGGTVEVI